MATITQPGNIQELLATEAIISSDSHITEPPDLWDKRLPASLRSHLPDMTSFASRTAGLDPTERVKEMATDGVSGEVLYATLGLGLLGVENPEAQEAAVQVGNDYMAEYCSAAPDRLWGIPSIACYDMKKAVRELERCQKMGLKGAMIWQVPPEHLRFNTDHYEDLWAAAQELNAPVNLHILSGFNYSRNRDTGLSAAESLRNSVNTKLFDAMTSLFDIIFSGVLERYPRLKIVLVENQIGWIPFLLNEWDRYVERFKRPLPIHELPSFYFGRQVYNTFFNDPAGGQILSFWGADNCMWSSDFPHGNSTWPNSPQVIARHMGHLSTPVLRKVLQENVLRLYDLQAPVRIGR